MATEKKTTKTTAKSLVGRVKMARAQIEKLLKDRSWIEEAKNAAEKQGRDVKKILDTDVAKLRSFLDKERKELEKLQARIPGEVKKIQTFVDQQKKELTRLLTNAKATAGKKANLAKKAAKKKATETRKKVEKAVGVKVKVGRKPSRARKSTNSAPGTSV